MWILLIRFKTLLQNGREEGWFRVCILQWMLAKMVWFWIWWNRRNEHSHLLLLYISVPKSLQSPWGWGFHRKKKKDICGHLTAKANFLKCKGSLVLLPLPREDMTGISCCCGRKRRGESESVHSWVQSTSADSQLTLRYIELVYPSLAYISWPQNMSKSRQDHLGSIAQDQLTPR